MERNYEDKKKQVRPAVILIVDGLGTASEGEKNIISKAGTPYIDELVSKYPTAVLEADKKSPGNNYYHLGGGKNSMSALAEEAGLRQLKISEAEKYAYLNFFFNGKDQESRKNEKRILVGTELLDDYSRKPAMATPKIIDQIIRSIKDGEDSLIMAALTNLDMAAYSSNETAIHKAVREIDKGIRKISKAILNKDGFLFITAAKGGAESLGKKGWEPWKVPFLMINKDWEGRTIGVGETPGSDLSLMRISGTLADVAPTILKAIGLEYNGEGKSLIES